MKSPMKLSSLVVLMFSLTLVLAGCIRFQISDPKPAEISATTVIVEAGKPVKLLQTTDPKAPKIIVVAALLSNDKVQVKQDISGWVAMPPSHWEQVKAALDRLVEYEKAQAAKQPPPKE